MFNRVHKLLLGVGLLTIANNSFALNDAFKQLLSSWWIDNTFLIVLLFLLFAAYTNWMIYRRHIQVTHEIKKLSKHSDLWNIHNLRVRIKDIYHKWFEANFKNDPEILKGYVGEHLYNHCYLEFSRLTDKGVKEVFSKPKLHDYYIISLHSGSEETQDIVWAYLKYAQAEYEVKENTEELVDGKPGMAPIRKELWKFIRQNDCWVLDSIMENIYLKDIEALINIED